MVSVVNLFPGNTGMCPLPYHRRMHTLSWPALCSAVILFMVMTPHAAERPAGAPPVRNERFIAGELCGRYLYWENRELLLDTVGWNALARQLLKVPSAPGSSPGSSGDLFEKAGKKILECKNVNAMSLAILADLGYPLAVLSQWSGTVRISGIDARGRLDSGNLLSDFIWEPLDSAVVSRPWKAKDEFSIRFFFRNNGCSDFKGGDDLFLARVQIMGTRGLGLKEKNVDYIPDENLYRLILGIYLCADLNRKTADIVDEIEESMDALKLGFGYKAPLIAELK